MDEVTVLLAVRDRLPRLAWARAGEAARFRRWAGFGFYPRAGVSLGRAVTKRTFPQVFEACRVRPVSDYRSHLLEMWEQINNFYLTLRGAVTQRRVADLTHEFFTDIMMASQLFTGITDSTMTHGEGWNFIRLGRMLERADKTSRLLDVKYFMLLPAVAYVGTPYDDLLWAAVLRSASAFEMYRKRYHQITPERVVAFLVLDREFPRAVHHCVVEAEEALRAISGTPGGSFRNQAERRLGRLRAELDFAEVKEILSGGLHEFLDDLQIRLNEVGQAVFDTFFALRPTVSAPSVGGVPAQ